MILKDQPKWSLFAAHHFTFINPEKIGISIKVNFSFHTIPNQNERSHKNLRLIAPCPPQGAMSLKFLLKQVKKRNYL